MYWCKTRFSFGVSIYWSGFLAEVPLNLAFLIFTELGCQKISVRNQKIRKVLSRFTRNTNNCSFFSFCNRVESYDQLILAKTLPLFSGNSSLIFLANGKHSRSWKLFCVIVDVTILIISCLYLIIKWKICHINRTWTLEYRRVEPAYISIEVYGKPIIFLFLFVIVVVSTLKRKNQGSVFWVIS